MAKFGIAALLIIIAFVIFIFFAQFLMRYMIVLLPMFYIVAVLSVGAKRALYGTAIFLFFCFAMWVRVGPSYNAVLGGSYVHFQDDANYHMRLIENMVQHFPHRISFDPYTQYPLGEAVPFAPFFDFLIALFIWVAGLGHPSLALTETMGAYYPAVLGALTVIPVYFIGKELFNNRNAGLLAAGLIAIASGEILNRSLLGFTDHHIAETLFSTIAMMFLIMTINRARASRPTFSNIKSKEWKNLKKPLLYSALAGLMLGIYLLSWIGGALFIGIILIYFVVQYLMDHLRKESTDYLFIIGMPMLLIALILTVPFLSVLFYGNTFMVALGLGLIGIPILSGISFLMTRSNVNRYFYPVILVALAALVALLFYFVDRSLFTAMIDKFKVFTPSTNALTVGEQHSILEGFKLSSLKSSALWWYHTTGVILVPLAFLIFFYSAVKERKLGKILLLCWVVIGILTIIVDQKAHVPWQVYLAEGLAAVAIYCYFEKNSTKVIFIIWSLVILIATLGQTRFDYYLAVNAALLSCYVLWKIPAVIDKIFQFVGWKAALTQDRNTKASKKRRNKELEEERVFSYFKPKYLSGFLSLIAIFFLTVYPNLLYGLASNKAWDPDNSAVISRASNPSATIPTDWYNSLVWMKDNTPDPFWNDSFFDSLYDKPANGGAYAYPNTSYGVMSWWDYGHWITLIAHRIPNANPFQSGIGGPGPNGSVVPGACTFMTAQDEANGSAILDELGSRYVIIDFRTAGIFSSYIDYANPNSIFNVMPIWAGQDPSNYYDIWFYEVSSGYAPMMVVHPAYYESMCVRLFTFHAQAVVPYTNSTWALSYKEVKGNNGNSYKIVTGSGNGKAADGSPLPFETYDEAAQYVQDHPGYMIVGVETQSNNNKPFLNSAVPLEALQGYKLVHASDTIVARTGAINISYVEIFEYTNYKH